MPTDEVRARAGGRTGGFAGGVVERRRRRHRGWAVPVSSSCSSTTLPARRPPRHSGLRHYAAASAATTAAHATAVSCGHSRPVAKSCPCFGGHSPSHRTCSLRADSWVVAGHTARPHPHIGDPRGGVHDQRARVPHHRCGRAAQREAEVDSLLRQCAALLSCPCLCVCLLSLPRQPWPWPQFRLLCTHPPARAPLPGERHHICGGYERVRPGMWCSPMHSP